MLSLCSLKHSTCKHIGQLLHQHEKWPIKWQLNYLHALYNLVCGDHFLYHVFHLRWGFPLVSLSSRSYFKLSRPHHCGDKGCCYVYTVLSLINVLFLNILCFSIELSPECYVSIKLPLCYLWSAWIAWIAWIAEMTNDRLVQCIILAFGLSHIPIL